MSAPARRLCWSVPNVEVHQSASCPPKAEVVRNSSFARRTHRSLAAPRSGEGRGLVPHRPDGSTALSGRLDPEDLRDVIGAYHRVVAKEAGRFGGNLE